MLGLSREALVDAWIESFGKPPPKGISRRLLEYAVAYHLQAGHTGGLTAATKRMLRQAALSTKESAQTPQGSARSTILSPGSRLVREWHGRAYTVDVTESGVLYNGNHYKSLSEVARTITGARWSGPRFFGQ